MGSNRRPTKLDRNINRGERWIFHIPGIAGTDRFENEDVYSAFVDGTLDAPKSLLSEVHRYYFEPQYPEFSPRTMWSLSNAFTSAFKALDPVPQFKATAKSQLESISGFH